MTAAGLSPHTIADYKNTFKKLFLFFDGEIPFQDISRKDIVDFFAWLQEDYISNPDGVAPRRNKPLSPKSIRNIHTNLSAFWGWAIKEESVQKNVVKGVDKPPATPPVIESYTKDDVVAILKVCDMSRTWKTRASIANTRPTADRDRAIMLTLLDTGVRASELCGM
jgi:integrase/recombinase XerD